MTKTYGKQVVYPGNRPCGGSAGNIRLDEHFAKEVNNARVIWYVDYFTEDGSTYSVRYLVDDGGRTSEKTIMITNENRDRRVPSDVWSSEDVEPWFEKNGVNHTMMFLFNPSDVAGETFGIFCAPKLIFSFGSRALMLSRDNMWPTYLQDGILGAMKLCGEPSKLKLEAIVANPRVDFLDRYDLRQDFILGMATALDK